MSEYTITFWVMVGTIGTAVATFGLIVAAMMAWSQARKSLNQMTDESEAADKRNNDQLTEMRSLETKRIQNQALFELLGVYSELDEATGTTDGAVRAISHRLRVAEQRFIMIYEYEPYPTELSLFHDCLLGAAYASTDESMKKNGAFPTYRRITGSKNRQFRDFYRGVIDADGLVSQLGAIGRNIVEEEPYFFPTHLVEEVLEK